MLKCKVVEDMSVTTVLTEQLYTSWPLEWSVLFTVVIFTSNKIATTAPDSQRSSISMAEMSGKNAYLFFITLKNHIFDL